MSPRVGFCPDAGHKVGLGHLRRCQAFAAAAEKLGAKAEVLAFDAAALAAMKEAGAKAKKWPGGRWDALVVDSYRTPKARHAELRRAAKRLLYVVDDSVVPAPCDWAFNSSVLAPKKKLAGARAERAMLGPAFHLFREEFARPVRARRARRSAPRVLVTLGGGETMPVGEAVRAALEAAPGCVVDAVLGPGAPEPPFLPQGRVFWHRAPRSMRKLMEAADAAVSGGGQTLYELARVGTPAVAVELAPNQRDNVRGMAEAGVHLSAGRWDKGAPKRVRAALRRLLNDAALRRRLARAGKKLVDGRGADRAARLLLSSCR